MVKLKLGDKVKWGNGGHVNEHVGVVTLVIPAMKPYTNDKYDPRSRNHESYEVSETIGKRKPKKYWPPVNSLREVDDF